LTAPTSRTFFAAARAEIDWAHLVRRFGPDWRVLLSHLILFGYIYPGERRANPGGHLEDLLTQLRS